MTDETKEPGTELTTESLAAPAGEPNTTQEVQEGAAITDVTEILDGELVEGDEPTTEIHSTEPAAIAEPSSAPAMQASPETEHVEEIKEPTENNG